VPLVRLVKVLLVRLEQLARKALLAEIRVPLVTLVQLGM
jgi:hypothetical protein